MFKKIEHALGDLLEEMAPARPEIDPPDQRRRPDMSRPPGDYGRSATGEAPNLPPPSAVVRTSGGEGRRAPREAPMPEGRLAPREQPFPEGNRPPRRRTNLRTTIDEGAPMTIDRRRASGMRKNLSNPAAIRNAFRVMEILGRPVSMRDLPDSDRLLR